MSNETSKITKISFSILNPENLLKESCAKINVATLYDSNNEPKYGGLFDPRMGVIERKYKCKTCEQTYINCPGHFGHIELTKPILIYEYLSYVIKILKCVCVRCSKLLVNKKHIEIQNIMKIKNNKKRFTKLINFNMPKICGMSKDENHIHFNNGCGAIQPNKIFNKMKNDIESVYLEWMQETENKKKEKVIQEYSPEITLSILKRISKEDSYAMGFHEDWCLPHWLVCTVIPVIPPCARPSVKMYNNQRSEDDLTRKYVDIIKANNIIAEKYNNSTNLSNNSDEILKNYIIYVASLYNLLINNNKINKNNNLLSLNKNGQKSSSLHGRLNGKEGRFRGTLLGKRVDFSSRTVISGDSELDADQLGVPTIMAKHMSFPEVVNKFNINKIHKLYKENKIKTYTDHTNGIKKHLEYVKLKEIDFKYGDMIERELQDEDIVLFNRQPSLHKMSMLAHKIKILDGNTFRLNVNVVTPYNADFDGDEMNMHIPRSYQTRMEIQNIAGVNKQIISPRMNSPIISPTQDTLLGLYQITDENVYFNRKDMMNMLINIQLFNGILPKPIINEEKKKRWSGKQLFSIILPNINIKKGDCEIVNGELIKGQIDKKISNMIMHFINNDYNNITAITYLNNLQKIIIRYLPSYGFSVGIEDVIIHKDIKKMNEDIIKKTKEDVMDMDKQIHLNIFENISNNISEVYEAKARGIIQKTTQKLQSTLISHLDNNNKINYMIKSGSKGGPTNITQMSSLLGQQDQNGKRIGLYFNNRTLPHYVKFDNSIENRGYISSSFIEGLNPREFFFHCIAGREGLIDTAVKTAKSGYIQRKLIKTMEDLKIAYDLTVRSSNNDIVQFKYGYDGFNSTHIEKQIFNLHFISQEQLNTDYILNINDNWSIFINKIYYKKMIQTKDINDIFNKYNKKIYEIIKYIHTVYCSQVIPSTKKIKPEIDIFSPVHFNRLINNTKNNFNLKKLKVNITPVDIINTINNIIKIMKQYKNHNKILEYLLYDYLSPNKLIKHYYFNKNALNHLEKYIITRFKKSIIPSGDMVGCVAAQSIGEPTSQMSVIYEEEITLMINKKSLYNNDKYEIYKGPIGQFIDTYFKNNKDTLKYVTQNKDSSNAFIDIEANEIFVLTVNRNNEKVEWKSINQVSRHPVNGRLVKFTTKSGRNITSTLSHSHLKRTNDEIISINGSDIKVGDRIPVVKKNKIFNENNTFLCTKTKLKYALTYNMGFLIGNFLLYGTFENGYLTIINDIKKTNLEKIIKLLLSKNDYLIELNHKNNMKKMIIKSEYISNFIKLYFTTNNNNKKIDKFVLNSNKEFIGGLLESYIDKLNLNNIVNKYEFNYINDNICTMITKILGYFNIVGIINRENKTIIIDNILFDNYDIIPESNEILNNIYKNNRYQKNVKKSVLINHYNNIRLMKNMESKSKNIEILEKIINNDIYWDEIINIEFIDNYDKLVYDIAVKDNNTFCLESGIFTHNTLNTFHYAGVGEKSNVTSGVPRLEELLNKQKPKTTEMDIFLIDEIKQNKSMVEDINFNLEVVLIQDILSSSAIYMESNNNYNNTLEEDKDIFEIYKIFSELDSDYKGISNNPWLIRLEFDRNKLLTTNILMNDIYYVLKNNFQNINIIYSDDHANKLIFRIKINFVSNPNKVENDYNHLVEIIDNIKSIKIKGVTNIKKTYVKENNCYIKQEGDIYVLSKEYYITTEGSNLFEILCKKYVDKTRTYSFDINEIYEIFGIEGARFVLEEQINNIFKFTGAYTNPRHIALLCDTMCNKGKIMPTNRHGINNSNIGPLAKCSFEETQDQLKTAALFGSVDDMTGISANIIAGQLASCGTGYSTLVLDMDKLKDINEDKEVKIEKDELNDIFNDTEEFVNNDLLNLDTIEGDDIII